MDATTLSFLAKERVSVVGIVQNDGTVHAATVHFAYNPDSNMFYFLTHASSRKCRSLISGNEVSASVVVGFNEEACATFQADGTIKIVKGEELESGWKTYGGKYPERLGAKESTGVVILGFAPGWHRFSATDVKERFKA